MSESWDAVNESLDACLRLVNRIRDDTQATRQTQGRHSQMLERRGEMLEEILRRLAGRT